MSDPCKVRVSVRGLGLPGLELGLGFVTLFSMDHRKKSSYKFFSNVVVNGFNCLHLCVLLYSINRCILFSATTILLYTHSHLVVSLIYIYV